MATAIQRGIIGIPDGPKIAMEAFGSDSGPLSPGCL